jgi:hypothetical protein
VVRHPPSAREWKFILLRMVHFTQKLRMLHFTQKLIETCFKKEVTHLLQKLLVRELLSSHLFNAFEVPNGRVFVLVVFFLKVGLIEEELVAVIGSLHLCLVVINRLSESLFVVSLAAFFKPRFEVFKRCLDCFFELEKPVEIVIRNLRSKIRNSKNGSANPKRS